MREHAILALSELELPDISPKVDCNADNSRDLVDEVVKGIALSSTECRVATEPGAFYPRITRTHGEYRGPSAKAVERQRRRLARLGPKQ